MTHLPPEFDQVLSNLHMRADTGLVLCNRTEGTLFDSEILLLDEAKKIEADAVFFRRHYRENEEQPFKSEPAVYIFQREDDFFNSSDHTSLHAKLWSSGKSEVYMLVGRSRIDVVNARRPAEVINTAANELNLENLRLVSNALNDFNDQRFSAHIFGTGLFWEQEDFTDSNNLTFYGNRLSEDYSPFDSLISYLSLTKKHFEKSENRNNLSIEAIHKMLIICILIKYMEGIRDAEQKHTLRQIYTEAGVDSFEQILNKGGQTFLETVSKLAGEFNGKVFDFFSDDEKQHIEAVKLNPLADFLTGKLDLKTKQHFLWEQYDFNHLPAELISSIYESFLPGQKDVVYTPPVLVNFLIDEVMPLDRAEKLTDNSFKILDPSCGSGVFLVAAYKRLLQWWTINEYRKTGKAEMPSKEICQEILEKNIFGTDNKPTAVLISIFSLTITLLDKLSPKEIWNGLKFKDLRGEVSFEKEINNPNNVTEADFFEWAAAGNKNKFDLVIGNPPFNGPNKKTAVKIPEELIVQIGFKHTQVPGNSFALQFFEAAMTLGEKVCLIIPSGPLLYNRADTTFQYRKNIFTDFTIDTIFDFTHLREKLFAKKIRAEKGKKPKKTGRTPVCALIAKNKPSEYQTIEHTVVKLLVTSEKKTAFSIDHYDRHFVAWNWAVDPNKQFIWKTNLLGGGLLFFMVYRFSLMRSLADFINQKTDENDEWTYSVGFKLAGSPKKLNIDYLHKKDTIVTETFNDNEQFETFIQEEKDFAAPRNQNIYLPPHLIIKPNIKNNIPIHLSNKELCFKDKLIGLHSPLSEKETLTSIYNLFKTDDYSRLSKLLILATSSEILVNLETSGKKSDIDSLPFPENEKHLQLSEAEQVVQDDVLNYYIHLGKSIHRAGRPLHERVNQEQLENFGKIFCSLINEFFTEKDETGAVRQEWHSYKAFQSPLFTVFQFRFGPKQSTGFAPEFRRGEFNEADSYFQDLVYNNKENRAAVYSRVLRFYDYIEGYDCVFFVKPNALRYWLGSIALRDADETVTDYQKAGF